MIYHRPTPQSVCTARRRYGKIGAPGLHARLQEVDPITAARLQPNDSQRIQRALEIYMLTGKAMSSLIAQQPRSAMPFEMQSVSLEPSDRSVLHERIARRFDLMLEQGFLDEVRPQTAPRAARRIALDPLRRLPPSMGLPRRQHQLRRNARTRHHRHPTTGQTPTDVATIHPRTPHHRLQ